MAEEDPLAPSGLNPKLFAELRAALHQAWELAARALYADEEGSIALRLVDMMAEIDKEFTEDIADAVDAIENPPD